MADHDGQGREARPEDEFLEGVKLAVHRRTGQWPWMDQVEDDFLPLLRKYKAAVTKAHDAEVAAGALREAADAVGPALATEVGGHTSTYSVRRWLQARADTHGDPR